MAIKKFKVEVTRTDEFIIEIDESIYTEEWREKFAEAFWPLEDTEDIAKDIAETQTRCGDSFKEGYGYIKKDGKLWFPYHDKEPAKGLNIIQITEDDDYESEVTEIIDK